MADYQEHLFSYRFDGAQWSFTIMATNEAEAKERLKQIVWARYEGVLAAKIPAVPGAGLFVRLLVAIRNFFRPPERRG